MSTAAGSPSFRPSIALPTGPYDWHPEQVPRALFEARLAEFRVVMSECGVSHAVVHGNGFDHESLFWLTHFTPKLGPAYALVPAEGPLRLLFAGGPGMKPSAQKLTWVEDVVSVKGIATDLRAWLGATEPVSPGGVGLVEGSAMLRCDWKAVIQAAGKVVELDEDLGRLRKLANETANRQSRSAETLAHAERVIAPLALHGVDLRQLALAYERSAYADGAQDVRFLVGRRAGGPPTTLTDDAMPMTGPTWFAVFLRQDGEWQSARFQLAPVG